MEEIKQAIEKSIRDDVTFGNSNIPVTIHCFTEYRLFHLLSLVAEKQREEVWDWYIHWMFTDEELEKNEHLMSMKAFLDAPLITDTLKTEKP